MFNSRIYTYSNDELTWEDIQVPEPRDILRVLERAASQGLDETAPFVQQVFNDYLRYDPKNSIIFEWHTGNDFVTVPLEKKYPWLRFYLGDPEAPEPPADTELAARQLYLDDTLAAFKRRLFTSRRAKQVHGITVDVGGLVFDGDETAQTRMARAIAVGQSRILDQLEAYLVQAAGDENLTPQALAAGLHQTLVATRAALTTTWVLADNTAVEVTLDTLSAACEASLLEMGAVWVDPDAV